MLGWLEERGRALGRASALATAWRCRGLLAAARQDPEGALAAFDRALREHARAGMPFERARTSCAWAPRNAAPASAGTRARRSRRRACVRSAGCAAVAQRAEAELRRIGGRRSSGDELTPAERQVADHVARGESNKQVAAALYLSPKTVEGHLRSIFRKLGVHSRSELTRKRAQRAEIGDFIVSGPPGRA